VPDYSRVATGGALSTDMLTDTNLTKVQALQAIASRRGQSLAQYALAWALRDPRMTSLVIGASSVGQLDANLDALANLEITDTELTETDQYATEGGINLWSGSTPEE
jgi:L-glyceraldehyde 3-phosphate reductase